MMEDNGHYPLKVRLHGGLGNQMFQFAGAITISRLARRPLTLDVSDLDITPAFPFSLFPRASSRRSFGLNYFGPIKNIEVVRKDLFLKVRNRKRLFPTSSLPVKRSITDEEELASLTFDRKDIEIDGYFQDLKFLPDDDTLSKYFAYPINKSRWLEDRFQELSNKPNIALHVRRGDYLKHKNLYDIISPQYYKSAVEILQGLLGACSITLFSDDIQAAKAFLGGDLVIDNVIYPEKRASAPEVLELMSNFDGIVMANSTFSWWAATLGEIAGKCTSIVMPHQFISIRSNEFHLKRHRWITIDNVSGIM